MVGRPSPPRPLAFWNSNPDMPSSPGHCDRRIRLSNPVRLQAPPIRAPPRSQFAVRFSLSPVLHNLHHSLPLALLLPPYLVGLLFLFMHRALQIPELRIACASHLADHPRELSHLARTNKDFRDPALDELYRSITDLMVLFRRFSSRTVQIVDNSRVRRRRVSLCARPHSCLTHLLALRWRFCGPSRTETGIV